MRNLEFVYKIDEFKFKEQIALSFQNWGLFVCYRTLLNYHAILSYEFLLLTINEKRFPWQGESAVDYLTLIVVYFITRGVTFFPLLVTDVEKNLVAILYIGYKKLLFPKLCIWLLSLPPESWLSFIHC